MREQNERTTDKFIVRFAREYLPNAIWAVLAFLIWHYANGIESHLTKHDDTLDRMSVILENTSVEAAADRSLYKTMLAEHKERLDEQQKEILNLEAMRDNSKHSWRIP